MAWLCENPEADPHRLSPREPFTFDLGGSSRGTTARHRGCLPVTPPAGLPADAGKLVNVAAGGRGNEFQTFRH
jgi:hypothetical protein